VSGLVRSHAQLPAQRPFRAPHHTCSEAGLLGGGAEARPGELSLAHTGVLFLEDLPEFRRMVISALRAPTISGWIQLSSRGLLLTYPCRALLVASAHLCPCGFAAAGSARTCTCREEHKRSYQARLVNLVADFDISATLDGSQPTGSTPPARPSSWYRHRVTEARQRQAHRFASDRAIHCNAAIPPERTADFCLATDAARQLLEQQARKLRLSSTTQHRVLVVARTVADLAAHERITPEDLAVAFEHHALLKLIRHIGR
jgi:magnesium chelatase family protein